MNGLISSLFRVMHFLRRISFIPIASVILTTHGQAGDLFSLDRLEPIQYDPLVDDFWNSNELASIPDLTPSLFAEDTLIEPDDINLITDFSSDIFAANLPDLILSSSACNTDGRLTNDFLQARDDRSSCSTTGGKQQDIDLPNIFDENFLPQSLETTTVEKAEQSSQGTVGKQPGDPGWAASGLAIPEALRLQEDPELCPRDIFVVSTIPVCNNPVTGGIEYETAKLYATLFNLIPCMCCTSFLICIISSLSKLTIMQTTVSAHLKRCGAAQSYALE